LFTDPYAAAKLDAAGFDRARDTSALEAGRSLLASQARREHGSSLYRIATVGIGSQGPGGPASPASGPDDGPDTGRVTPR